MQWIKFAALELMVLFHACKWKFCYFLFQGGGNHAIGMKWNTNGKNLISCPQMEQFNTLVVLGLGNESFSISKLFNRQSSNWKS